jgi:mRNA interferase HicA
MKKTGLDKRAKMSDNCIMNGSELIQPLKKVGRKNHVSVKFVSRRGKGSHGTLFYGNLFAIIPNQKNELKKGTLHAILSQLGLRMEDI